MAEEIKAVRASTGGLGGELKRLLAVVTSNHSELESHVKSSESFFRKATDQQVSSFALGGHCIDGGAPISEALLDSEDHIAPSNAGGTLALGYPS